MRIPLNTTLEDRISAQNFILLRDLLNGGLSLDNFKGRLLTGTTSSSANTSKTFKHGMTPKPLLALPLTGNVYTYSIDSDYVDIRSSQTSTNFVVFLISGKLDGVD